MFFFLFQNLVKWRGQVLEYFNQTKSAESEKRRRLFDAFIAGIKHRISVLHPIEGEFCEDEKDKANKLILAEIKRLAIELKRKKEEVAMLEQRAREFRDDDNDDEGKEDRDDEDDGSDDDEDDYDGEGTEDDYGTDEDS